MHNRNEKFSSDENKRTSAAVGVLNGILIAAVAVLLIIYVVNHIKGDRAVAALPDESSTATQVDFSGTSINVITEKTTVSELTTTETSSETTSETEAALTDNQKYDNTDYDKDFYSKTLFIGDSISTGLSGFGYIPSDNVFAKVGLNPESALTTAIDGETASSKAQKMQPERVCIMLGTNGLAYMDTDYMAKKMGELIVQIQSAAPDAEIVVISIPPVTAEHESEKPENNANIISYNADLKKLAEDNNCKFVDLYDELTDKDGYFSADYAEADGLHFLGKAYGVMLSFVESSLNGNAADEQNIATVVTEAATAAE